MLQLWKDKVYRRYWFAVVVSFLGDAITLTSIVFIVGTQSGSVMLISFALLAQLLPSVLIGPFIGPLIDQWNRRTILITADIYRLVVVLMMIPFRESPSLLIGLLFVQGVGTAFFEPARIASVPDLVGSQRIPQGIALFQSTSAVIKFSGPILAGVLLSSFSVALVFIYDAISFLVSALLLSSLSLLNTPISQVKSSPFLTGLSDGVRGLFQHKLLRSMLLMLMPIMVVIGMLATSFKTMLINEFHLNSLHYGWSEALFSLGMVTGALYGPRLIVRFTQAGLIRTSLLVVAFASLATCGLPFLIGMFGLFPILTWSLVLGFGESLLQVPISNFLLQQMPSEIRGRGIALSNSILNGCFAIGFLVGGLTTQGIGNLKSFLLAGGCLLVLLLFFLTTGSGLQSIERKKLKIDQ